MNKPWRRWTRFWAGHLAWAIAGGVVVVGMVWVYVQQAHVLQTVQSQHARFQRTAHQAQVDRSAFVADVLRQTDSDVALRKVLLHLNRGIEAYHKGEFVASVQAFNGALAQHASHPYLLQLKGRSLLGAKQYVEAVSVLESVTLRRPDHGWAYYDLARAQCECHNFVAAKQAIDKALVLDASLRDLMASDPAFVDLCGRIWSP